jgi:DNA-binding NtrC family response regulator
MAKNRYSIDFLSLVRLSLYDNEILILLTSKGTIKDLQIKDYQQSSWSSYDYYKKILPKTDIRDYYDLPKNKGIKDIATPLDKVESLIPRTKLFLTQNVFYSKNKYENHMTFFNFYATLPYSRLYINYSDDIGFFGIIRFNELGTITDYYRASPIIVLSNEGIMKGVNGVFLDIFKAKNLSASDILDNSVDKYMRPSPFQAICGNPDDFNAILKEPWQFRYVMNKLSQSWQQVSLQPYKGIIQLKEPLDNTEVDVKLEFEVTVKKGLLPSVILNGVKDYARFFPDYNGYQIGPDPGNPVFQFKKEGFVAFWADYKPVLSKGRHTVTIVRRNNYLAYFLDQKLMVGYRDPSPCTSEESFQYIHKRENDDIILHGLKVYTLPVHASSNMDFNEVTFFTGKENAYRFQTMCNDSLRFGKELFYAFILHDISFLKKNIALLQKARVHIARDRDKYKALALGEDAKQDLFIGENPDMLRLKKDARKVAASPMTVLVEGETGTGKEILAKYIHDNSPQRTGPFVKVDCSTLPGSLLESELFGVEKGAFTGAVERREGKLEAAKGGTLFLDELANLNAPTQAKFLNFLQDFTLERLGSTKKIKVETRLIAATNVPLKDLVDQGRFRHDLYYRLATVKFLLPPLRDRRDDITRLCTHFLKHYNEKFNRSIKGFTPAGFQRLMAYDWPGNVRELENVIQKAVLYCEKDVIDRDQIDLPLDQAKAVDQKEEIIIPKGDARAFTREHIVALLKRNNYIIERAAKAGNISRTTLFRKIKKFNIRTKATL